MQEVQYTVENKFLLVFVKKTDSGLRRYCDDLRRYCDDTATICDDTATICNDSYKSYLSISFEDMIQIL